jgi:hypothetical protein
MSPSKYLKDHFHQALVGIGLFVTGASMVGSFIPRTDACEGQRKDAHEASDTSILENSYRRQKIIDAQRRVIDCLETTPLSTQACQSVKDQLEKTVSREGGEWSSAFSKSIAAAGALGECESAQWSQWKSADSRHMRNMGIGVFVAFGGAIIGLKKQAKENKTRPPAPTRA